jgi:hypothetical protein
MSTPHFPGWYPDPDQSGRERLWDGQAWTHHLRKAAEGSGRLGPRTIALATGSGVLGLLLIVGLVASGTDRHRAPCSRKQSIRAADICSVHAAPETSEGSGR